MWADWTEEMETLRLQMIAHCVQQNPWGQFGTKSHNPAAVFETAKLANSDFSDTALRLITQNSDVYAFQQCLNIYASSLVTRNISRLVQSRWGVGCYHANARRRSPQT